MKLRLIAWILELEWLMMKFAFDFEVVLKMLACVITFVLSVLLFQKEWQKDFVDENIIQKVNLAVISC